MADIPLSLHDVIVDCLFEDQIIETLEAMGRGRLVMAGADPFLNDDGCLTVRVKDTDDPQTFARELQRRVGNLRVVEIVDRLTGETSEPAPGSYAAQRKARLLGKYASSPFDARLRNI